MSLCGEKVGEKGDVQRADFSVLLSTKPLG